MLGHFLAVQFRGQSTLIYRPTVASLAASLHYGAFTLFAAIVTTPLHRVKALKQRLFLGLFEESINFIKLKTQIKSDFVAMRRSSISWNLASLLEVAGCQPTLA